MARASTFTTYINAKDDPSINTAFDKLTTKAVSSYDKIRQGALAASKAQLGLLGGSGSAGGGVAATTRNIDGQAKSVDALARSYRSASPNVTGLITSTRAQGAASALAARHNNELAQSLRTTATALTVVQGPLGPVAGRVSALANAVEQLTGLRLGLVGVAASLFTVGRLGNNYAQLASQVRGAFVDQTRSNSAMEDIIGIANRAKVGLESVTGLYIRLSQAAAQAGVSQKDATRVTELAAKAARLSGGSTQTQNDALVQFTQAYGADFKGGGQELQSINEGANQLGVAIANGLGVPLGKLKELGAQGKLSTEVVTQALLKSASDIERRYASLGNTLGGSLAQLGTAGTVMVGKFDQAIGFTSTLADSISVVAGNLRAITGLILGVGVALGAARVGPFVAQTVAGVQASIVALTQEADLKRGNALQDRFYAAENLRQSEQEVVATRARVVALTQEKLAIDAKVAALEAERLVANQTVSAARANPAGVTGYTRGSAGVSTADAEVRAQNATRALTDAQEKQRAVQAALGAETLTLSAASGNLATSTEYAATTMARAVPRAGLLGGALSKLKAVGGGIVSLFGGPLGLALAAATTAFFLLETAESAAEKALRLNEDAQRDFETQVDRTTGKVINQARQLELLAFAAKNSQARTAAATNFAGIKGTIVSRLGAVATPDSFQATGGTTGGGVSFKSSPRTDAAKQLQDAVQAFEQGQYGSFIALQKTVVAVKDKIPGLAAIAADIGNNFTQLRAAAAPLQQSSARGRLATGRGRAGDLQKVYGQDANGTGAAKQLSATDRNQAIRDGQISGNAGSGDALKKAAAERDKALSDLKKDTTLTAEQYKDQAAAIQDRYNTEVESIRASRKAASAARVQEHKEARDAIQDAKDAAEAKADADLTKLFQSGQDPNSQAFIDQRNAILKTYDDEVNKLDASAAASHRYSSQKLADAKKEAEAADQRGEKRTGILAQYDDAPKAIDTARKAVADLQELVDHQVKGVGFYTQAMADADARRIYEGIQKPLTDIFKESQQQAAINGLILQGRDAEAQALRQALDAREKGLTVDQQRYEALVRNAQQEQLINDALESRGRIQSQITGLVDAGRSSIEGLLEAVQRGGKINNPLSDIKNQLFRVQATQLTEQLFAGADAKIRALLTGRSAVDKAVDSFEGTVDNIDTATNKVISSFENMVAKVNSLTTALQTPTNLPGITPVAANDNGGSSASQEGDIVVTSTKLVASVIDDPFLKQKFKANYINPLGGDGLTTPTFKTPSAASAGATLFGALGGKLDSLVDQLRGRKIGADGVLKDGNGEAVTGTKLFKGIGDAVGKGLAGAGNGEFASNIAKSIGIKQSKTGAEIGGAAGQLALGPIGGIIGGLIGGTIGGLFKKVSKSSATIGVDANGQLGATTVSGSSSKTKKAASQLADSVGDQIQQIADQLGGTIGSASTSIGTRNGKYVVDTEGKGRTKYGKANDGITAYDTEEEAVAAAVQDMLQDGVITGISAASKKILASGQDLQRALTKATVIESIPKRLLALTNPVAAAVTDLNTEFATMISYLKEGGATAQQFGDAQKLYELERAQAISDATSQASSAIDAFIKNLTDSTSSPLNKLDTYRNASSTLDAFRSDIAAGKSVDQDKLLAAAQNFEDASKGLYGSSQDFFDDFDDLTALLTKARDNVTTSTSTTDLPASPFDNDATVQAALASLQTSSTAATTAQTTALSAKLDTVVAAINKQTDALSTVGIANDAGYGSAMKLLPAFA